MDINILFCHSNCGRISYLEINILLLPFELRPTYCCDINILFCHFELRPKIVFRHSIFYFDVRTEAEYHILIFKFSPNILFAIRTEAEYPIWTSISYFAIRTEAVYHIWTSISYFAILNWGRIYYLDINILFCHSN